jgi:uracil-DNA glycosylase
MLNYFPDDWKLILNSEFEKSYFKSLELNLEKEYQEKDIFPPKNEIFNAFKFCPFHNLKVVIIGQDPYHGIGQANGLCFSVNDGIAFPPSLKNIFIELKNDINFTIPISGNLEHWAKQGVLLLNATLTVEKSKAASHQKMGWEVFTNQVITKISEQKNQIIFLLWGGFAHQKEKLIDAQKHFILKSGHPSPLSANKGHWFGNQHFSKTNQILKQINQSEIEWNI